MNRMSKPADTWMPLYIGDYLADTQHLSGSEHGAYLLLIMAYWRNGGPLPDDDRAFTRITRFDPRTWRKIRPALEPFFIIDDPVVLHSQDPNLLHTQDPICAAHARPKLWRHKRIDAELENAEKLANAKRKGGKAGAAKRWGADSTPIDLPIASRAPVLPSPSPSPSLPTVSKETERESRAREAPGKVALSQSDFNQFEISEELIAEAAEARADAKLAPVNLRAEAAKFVLSKAAKDYDGWMRWALIARADLNPPPNGHDPPSYKPDVPDGPPPPLNWRDLPEYNS
jgi:uncharacterized protein YdaU (DUF1376 family)